MRSWYKTLIIILLLSSCERQNDGDCFVSIGKTVVTRRNTSYNETIRLEGKINLVLIPDSEYYFEVKAGEGLQKNILTSVRGTEVLISDENGCKFLKNMDDAVNVSYHFKDLGRIRFMGSGRITCAGTLKLDTLWIDNNESMGWIELDVELKKLYVGIHSGSPDVIVKGHAEKSLVFSAGNGFIRNKELISDSIIALNGGTGDFHIHATTYLNAWIKGQGNIFYSGKPYIELGDKGRGELISE